MSRVEAIKRFFEADGGRKIENREVLDLSKEAREELGQMCATALGAELDAPAAAA